MTNLHDRTTRLREAVVPGRLAEAMPDWLTEAVRPKPAPVPWGAMVRAALAICVPLSVGIVAGRRDIWLLLAVGGLTGTVIDTGGPYVVRVKRAVIAGVCGGAAGLVIGMLIHDRGWVAVASLVVVAGVSALISRLGSTASVTGLQLLVFTSLGLGPFGALRPWWHIVPGLRRRRRLGAAAPRAGLAAVPPVRRTGRRRPRLPRARRRPARDRHRPHRRDPARGHGRAQHRVRHPAQRAGDGRRPKPADDAPDGGTQRQFPGGRGGRYASPRGHPAAAARRRHPRPARRRDRGGRPATWRPAAPRPAGRRPTGRQAAKRRPGRGRSERRWPERGWSAHRSPAEPGTPARRAADPAAVVVQPWLSRAAGCPGGPRAHDRVDARHVARAWRRGYRCASAPGPCSAPCSTSFGADGSHGPSPSG